MSIPGFNEFWALQVALDNNAIRPKAIYITKDLLAKFTGSAWGGSWEELKPKSTMSPKQIALAENLVAEGKAWVAQNNAHSTTAISSGTVSIGAGGLQAILNLFASVNGKLKFPKIALNTEAGNEVLVYPAKATGKNPGCLYVRFNNAYVGKINAMAEWEPKGGTPMGSFTNETVEALLLKFAADPAGVAAADGKLTGRCCFCKHKLDTKESTEVGYGPVCAKAYGLPWGEKKLKTKADLAMEDLTEQVKAAGFKPGPTGMKALKQAEAGEASVPFDQGGSALKPHKVAIPIKKADGSTATMFVSEKTAAQIKDAAFKQKLIDEKGIQGLIDWIEEQGEEVELLATGGLVKAGSWAGQLVGEKANDAADAFGHAMQAIPKKYVPKFTYVEVKADPEVTKKFNATWYMHEDEDGGITPLKKELDPSIPAGGEAVEVTILDASENFKSLLVNAAAADMIIAAAKCGMHYQEDGVFGELKLDITGAGEFFAAALKSKPTPVTYKSSFHAVDGTGYILTSTKPSIVLDAAAMILARAECGGSTANEALRMILDGHTGAAKLLLATTTKLSHPAAALLVHDVVSLLTDANATWVYAPGKEPGKVKPAGGDQHA